MSAYAARPQRHPLRRLGVWLAMLALAFQALVVEPHIDLGPVGVQAGVQTQISAPNDNHSAPCLICQQLALSGAVTLAGSPTLGPVAHAFLDVTPAVFVAATRLIPAHPWQSRGPPTN